MKALGCSLALCAALAGCGLGTGGGSGPASVIVTSDFGTHVVGDAATSSTPGSETVMRFLQRHFRVRTRYGGGFVQSIDGLAATRVSGRPVDWFYYVNGIEASRGAASTELHDGDRVWWDRHDWGAAMVIPAVVGVFPEPFRSGSGGKRLPVVIACAAAATRACGEVSRRLTAAGIDAARGGVSAAPGQKTLRLLVGLWPDLRADGAAAQLEQGPRTSGVFARMDPSGTLLTVLDPQGRVSGTLGSGTGLVAAVRDRTRGQQPTWIVTGTDATGLLAAARALDEGDLAHHFALAVNRGIAVPLPDVGAP